MSSCNFGTSASFARLPIRDLVCRLSVKSVSGEGRATVSVGCGERGCGGVKRICGEQLVRGGHRRGCIYTVEEKSESEIVSDTGSRANDENG